MTRVAQVLRAMTGVSMVALAVALGACAGTPAGPGTPEVVKGLQLPPYGSHETCVQLHKGDRLDYRFTASVPVSFSLRYRDGNATIAPISRSGVTADSGIYLPIESREFCLAWDAGRAPVRLDYVVSVKPAAP